MPVKMTSHKGTPTLEKPELINMREETPISKQLIIGKTLKVSSQGFVMLWT